MQEAGIVEWSVYNVTQKATTHKQMICTAAAHVFTCDPLFNHSQCKQHAQAKHLGPCRICPSERYLGSISWAMTMTSGRRWLKSLQARRMASATALSTATRLASAGSRFTEASATCKTAVRVCSHGPNRQVWKEKVRLQVAMTETFGPYKGRDHHATHGSKMLTLLC